MTYSQSAEILLSIYEVKDVLRKNSKVLPKSLSIENKEAIIINYLDSNLESLIHKDIKDKFDYKSNIIYGVMTLEIMFRIERKIFRLKSE